MSQRDSADQPTDREAMTLSPGLPFIDCHHHLWDRGGQTYLSAEYLADAGPGLAGSVYVECLNRYAETGDPVLRPVGETAFVVAECAAARAQNRPICDGIIGFADLAQGAAVQPVLEAHQAAGDGRFRGIRYATAWDPDPTIHSPYNTRRAMLEEPAVTAGAQCLGALDLTLDVWVYFHQLPEVADLAGRCSDTLIVVNHCGGPIGVGPYRGQRDAVFAHWRSVLPALAAQPNIHLKFGGMAMKLAGFDWHRRDTPPDPDALAQAWQPYFDACMAAFGPERMMFESNFPVDRVGTGYQSLWQAFDRLSTGCSRAERASLFSETARRVYRLPTD